ncbi:MAG TPA: rod shape-determining protein RodA [Solirubrobacteraceae bacterium]|nr:rod shape-determining protein RodA [Solirubrobacteraceae bacterium]
MAGSPIVDPGAERLSRSGPRIAPPGLLRLDPILLLAVLGLGACSLVAIDATTEATLASRQGAFFGIGLAVALLVSQVDYSRLRELKYGVYGLMVALILAVIALGGVTRGSRRAIDAGPVELQTSELGKVLLCLALAAFLVDRSRRLNERDTTARAMLMALFPTALVMIQPDLGSALVYVVIALAALFCAGTSWRHFAGLFALSAAAIAIALVGAPKLGVEVLHDYQADRLTSFLHPSDDPGDAGYQQKQSVIAIGSGERTGRGEEATQTTLKFLPEEHTDFIFAVVGERWGFIGAALVLSLYALLIWRALRILTLAKNLYGAVIAGGIVAMILFQVFVNVGMNVGIMPITGIPLPLLSYGGSSVLTTLLAVGLLQSIHVQARASRKGIRT